MQRSAAQCSEVRGRAGQVPCTVQYRKMLSSLLDSTRTVDPSDGEAHAAHAAHAVHACGALGTSTPPHRQYFRTDGAARKKEGGVGDENGGGRPHAIAEKQDRKKRHWDEMKPSPALAPLKDVPSWRCGISPDATGNYAKNFPDVLIGSQFRTAYGGH